MQVKHEIVSTREELEILCEASPYKAPVSPHVIFLLEASLLTKKHFASWVSRIIHSIDSYTDEITIIGMGLTPTLIASTRDDVSMKEEIDEFIQNPSLFQLEDERLPPSRFSTQATLSLASISCTKEVSIYGGLCMAQQYIRANSTPITFIMAPYATVSKRTLNYAHSFPGVIISAGRHVKCLVKYNSFWSSQPEKTLESVLQRIVGSAAIGFFIATSHGFFYSESCPIQYPTPVSVSIPYMEGQTVQLQMILFDGSICEHTIFM